MKNPTKTLFALFALLLSTPAVAAPAPASAKPAAESTVLDLPLTDIDGKPTTLRALGGKAVLVVNVASRCGFTPQYKGLEALWQKYKGQGLVVAGFPANDFGAQEPGTEAEIKTFCSTKYAVSFPMFAKVKVKGAEKVELYKRLTEAAGGGEIGWNFTKMLVSADGAKVQRFDSPIDPMSAELTGAVEAALGK
jgi:glutathione peroxidase